MRYIALVAALCAALNTNAQTENEFGSLRFKEDGTFQISIFEDLHFGENAWDSWGPEHDLRSVGVINNVLDAESPDLVVLNGDLITGENGFLENATVYIDQIVAPLVDRGLTWASTYGNHDHQYNLSATDLLARENQYPNSRTQHMVMDKNAGVTNYYLPVLSSAGDGVPSLILWFFDSRGGNYFRDLAEPDTPQPNWVDQSVVTWFSETSAALSAQYGKTIPSLAFVHIPTNASLAAQTMDGINPTTEPGINEDYPLAQQGQGWCEDNTNSPECSYGGQDVPFMKALVETPGVLGVFSGHDHGATWCYRWSNQIPGLGFNGQGLNICFGQHSGYGGYGTWIRGSRQISISEEALARSELETWIRLEDASVVGAVSLNETYGVDIYPETPNDHTGN
ncbi:Metallo-dependent phosphatase-like protein [Aspergillus heterothallicus]